MRRLSLGILSILLINSVFSQSPHGEELLMDCALCHTSDSWSVSIDDISFDHNDTKFLLEGTHNQIDCKMCHPTLVFDEAPSDCVSCHGDIHNMTVGNDCNRCHNSETWLVDIIPELHEENGFPLIGAHSSISCDECHVSDTYLRFDRLGNECINCHRDDYEATQDPNHINAGYSTDCLECHSPLGFGWDANAISHGFFPLTLGHEIADCNECHTSGSFSDLSSECITCHQLDYENTLNPNHNSAQFSTDCVSCHTTDIGWTPATFDHDDQFFPIYSGKHEGEWNECIDCHTNPSNYAIFTCISCHINPETDDEHGGVDGYIFEDNACLACHPTGDEDEGFDHSSTQFMLTNGHFGVDCIECHSNGYENTSMICNDCHNVDFLNTTNPDHDGIGISIDCVDCHTTDLGWMPATFDTHNDYYPLNGAHAIIANDCVECHNGEYINTPNTCVACHQEDFDNTNDPNHAIAQFPTDCIECHTEDSWEPSTFDHDGQYFPIYSGGHDGEWSDCVECHPNPNNFQEYTCITCHDSQDESENHEGISGYVYESSACLACHPTGEGEGGFDHNVTGFILGGGHFGVDCLECHADGFAGTSPICNDCHNPDFISTSNPNHSSLGLSTDCASCHTTEPDWAPASFEDHDNFYALNGAHLSISNDCATCHNGDYNNTPTNCVGCHQSDFDNTSDPNHVVSQFPNDCVQCHSEDAWEPSAFDHNSTDFSLVGGHFNIDCLECHADGYTGTSMVCNECHNSDFLSTSNPNHNDIGISTDCINCHTTDPGWIPATFDNHDDYYPLNGAHATISNDCATCHNGDYTNTANTCVGCHQDDYNATSDPNHNGAQFNSDCVVCHNESAWDPSTFDHDNQYMPIYTDAHDGEWSSCTECHINSSNYQVFYCLDCHGPDTDNDHTEVDFYEYLSATCYDCHYQ